MPYPPHRLASLLYLRTLLVLTQQQGLILFFRLLEGLQAQLTTLVEQLSIPLALLPSSNLLLETAPEVLQKQLELLPGQLGASKAASLHKGSPLCTSSIKVPAAVVTILAQYSTTMHLALQYINVTVEDLNLRGLLLTHFKVSLG